MAEQALDLTRWLHVVIPKQLLSCTPPPPQIETQRETLPWTLLGNTTASPASMRRVASSTVTGSRSVSGHWYAVPLLYPAGRRSNGSLARPQTAGRISQQIPHSRVRSQLDSFRPSSPLSPLSLNISLRSLLPLSLLPSTVLSHAIDKHTACGNTCSGPGARLSRMSSGKVLGCTSNPASLQFTAAALGAWLTICPRVNCVMIGSSAGVSATAPSRQPPSGSPMTLSGQLG